MQVLDGKQTSLDIQQEIAQEVKALLYEGKKKPHLAAILVGNNGASETYVGAKVKACERVGFDSTLLRFDESITEEPENLNGENFNNLTSNNKHEDELYDQAVALIARERRASTSFIQRHFKIGYNRAATIIEKMEENNVVSKPGRAGKREVLIEDN